MELNKSIECSQLLKYYGSLVSLKQLNILQMYLDQDLTISEIANLLNVSRQCVMDTINKTQTKLLEIESKLKMYQNSITQKNLINQYSENKITKTQFISLLKNTIMED